MPRFTIKTYSAPFAVWTAIPAHVECQTVAICNGDTVLGLRYRTDSSDATTEGAQPLAPGAWLNLAAAHPSPTRFFPGTNILYVQPSAAGTVTVEVHLLY